MFSLKYFLICVFIPCLERRSKTNILISKQNFIHKNQQNCTRLELKTDNNVGQQYVETIADVSTDGGVTERLRLQEYEEMNHELSARVEHLLNCSKRRCIKIQ